MCTVVEGLREGEVSGKDGGEAYMQSRGEGVRGRGH